MTYKMLQGHDDTNLARLVNRIKEAPNYGFMSKEQLQTLALLDPFRQVLVRCGSCRLLVQARDVEHITEIISREGTDYVRDVSLPAESR